MIDRRAERLRLFESKTMHRADFEVRQAGWQRSEELASFLRFSNLEVQEIDSTRPLRARFAMFPHLTFAHVSGPKARIHWARDRNSLDRVFALIPRVGDVTLSTGGVMLRRGSGPSVLSPSAAPVTVSLGAADNEFLYVSVSPTLLAGIALPVVTTRTEDSVDPSLLAPAVMFMAGLCRISLNASQDTSPLRLASEEIARSLISQIIGDLGMKVGLFARAMELIVSDYADPRLSVNVAAARLGVASRTLQLAFNAEGTTVGAQIRLIRARAALRLHATNPVLTYSSISRAVGFGSESALYRALRQVDASEVEIDPSE